jgi:UDP-3-O-[3-hydroxymyristoyl] glucosamine N-acyltransferase
MQMWGEVSDFFDFTKSIGLTTDQAELIRSCQSIGLASHTDKQAMLTFAENSKFMDQALENSSTQTLISSEMPLFNCSKSIICVSNPRFVFWSLVEYTARKRVWINPSIIHETAIVKPGAIVSLTGCVLEAGVVVEEAAIVLPGVRIGKNCIIGPGSVIGSDGLEVKETIFGRIRITHDAGVVMEDNVTIGAGCTVNKGLLGQDTYIGTDTKIDSGVHIAHSCKIGPKNTITANVTLGGSVITEEEVFIGLNATVVNAVTLGSKSFIGAGSIVVRSIESCVKILPYPSKAFPIQ